MNNRSNKAPSQQHSSGSSSLASALTPWGKPGPVTARPPALIANLICRRLFFFSFLTPALELASPEKKPSEGSYRSWVCFYSMRTCFFFAWDFFV